MKGQLLNRTTLFVTIGIAGSGKSTWAAKMMSSFIQYELICPDDIRQELTGDSSNQQRNFEVFKIAHQRLRDALAKNRMAIWSATCYNRKNRKEVIAIGKEFDANIIGVIFNVSLETAKARNKMRSRVVPDDIIERQFNNFQPPTLEEGFGSLFYMEDKTLLTMKSTNNFALQTLESEGGIILPTSF